MMQIGMVQTASSSMGTVTQSAINVVDHQLATASNVSLIRWKVTTTHVSARMAG